MLIDLGGGLVGIGRHADLSAQVGGDAVLLGERNPRRIEEERGDGVDPIRRDDITGERIADITAGAAGIRPGGFRVEI